MKKVVSKCHSCWLIYLLYLYQMILNLGNTSNLLFILDKSSYPKASDNWNHYTTFELSDIGQLGLEIHIELSDLLLSGGRHRITRNR